MEPGWREESLAPPDANDHPPFLSLSAGLYDSFLSILLSFVIIIAIKQSWSVLPSKRSSSNHSSHQLTSPFSDLSSCQLVQVPDAIFHLMRETPLTTCNLASNIITKIPPKLAMSFTLITGERFADPYELC